MYDSTKRTLFKKGDSLKEHDLVRLQLDSEGNYCEEKFTWRVEKIEHYDRLESRNIELGEVYWVYDRQKKDQLREVRCTGKQITDELNFFTFTDIEDGISETVSDDKFPALYRERQHGPKSIVFKYNDASGSDNPVFHTNDFSVIRNEEFELDISQTNVVIATGKPAKYSDHLKVTDEVSVAVRYNICKTFLHMKNLTVYKTLHSILTKEPYGVCCTQGLKISMV